MPCRGVRQEGASGAGSWGGCVEHNEGEVGRAGRGQHAVLRSLDRILGHVTAVKWGRCKDCSGAKEGPSWRGGGLKKVPGVQASPGRPLEMLAGLGSVTEGPSLVGLFRRDYTLRPSRSIRLCGNTRTHTVPCSPSSYWPSALPWEGPRALHTACPPCLHPAVPV